MDQNITLLAEARERGLIQLQVVVGRMVAKLQIQVAQASGQTARTRHATAAYNDSFLPACRKLTSFIEHTYAPRARQTIALTAIPDAKRLYGAQVRTMTTTTMSPEQIHEIGKREVERLESEMIAAVRETGFGGSLAAFQQNLRASPEQRFRSKDEMLAYCRNVAKSSNPTFHDSSGTFHTCCTASGQSHPTLKLRPPATRSRSLHPMAHALAGST